MEWRKITGQWWPPLLGLASFVVGVPGLLDDAAAWRQWIGDMSPLLSGVFMGVGGALIGLWVFVKLSNLIRSKAKGATDITVDYMTACVIANRYIDPDQTMTASKLIAVRAQILARFDKVVGARIGDQYNGQLLRQWFQKNAARSLVAHQDEIT